MLVHDGEAQPDDEGYLADERGCHVLFPIKNTSDFVSMNWSASKKPPMPQEALIAEDEDMLKKMNT
ncbi:MAG: hypothetical protein ACLVJ6_16080 [Merdibacter sp.]